MGYKLDAHGYYVRGGPSEHAGEVRGRCSLNLPGLDFCGGGTDRRRRGGYIYVTIVKDIYLGIPFRKPSEKGCDNRRICWNEVLLGRSAGVGYRGLKISLG